MKIIHGAFIAIIAQEAKPFRNDTRLDESAREATVPVVLMINRADGKIGFPGGTMEDGETPLETVIRETSEEIGITVEEHELEYVGVTKFKREGFDLTTHLFSMFVEHEDLSDIAQNIANCDHFGSEICGYWEVGIVNHKKGGYREFIKNNFPPTAKEQLEMIVTKYNLLVEV